jgi:uncharacterized protein (DUF433 family)
MNTVSKLNGEEIIQLYEKGNNIETIAKLQKINPTSINRFINMYYAERAPKVSDEEIVSTYTKNKDFHEVKIKYGITKKQLGVLMRRNKYKRTIDFLDEEERLQRETDRKMNIIQDYEDGITILEIKEKYQAETVKEIRSILLNYYQNIGENKIKQQLTASTVEKNIQIFLKEGRTLSEIYQALLATKKIIPKSIKDNYFQEISQKENENIK